MRLLDDEVERLALLAHERLDPLQLLGVLGIGREVPGHRRTSSRARSRSGSDCAMDSAGRPASGRNDAPWLQIRVRRSRLHRDRCGAGPGTRVRADARRATAPRSWSTISAAARDGTGADAGPAQEVVDEITAAGRRGGRQHRRHQLLGRRRRASCSRRSTRSARLDVLVNNAGILRDRMLFSMTEEEWDARDQGAPQGHVRAEPPRRGVLARAVEGRRGRRRAARSTPRRCRASTPTSARPTTARPRPASRRSRRSPPRSSSRYGVTVNAIGPGALHAAHRRPRDDRRDPRQLRSHLGRAGDHLAGVAGLRRRDRSGHRGVRPRARHRRGLAPRSVAPSRWSRRRRSARACASCWPRPGRAPGSTR